MAKTMKERRGSKLGPESTIIGAVVTTTLRDFVSSVAKKYHRSRSATIAMLLDAYTSRPDWLTEAMTNTSGTSEED